MTPEEQVSRNIEWAFTLLEDVLRDPSELEKIPDGRAIIATPQDDKELADANLEMIRQLQERAASRAAQSQVGRLQHTLDTGALFANV